MAKAFCPKYGRSIDACHDFGDAICYNRTHTSCLLEFIKLGADVNDKDEDDKTPLEIAVGNMNIGAIHVLIDHGADIEAKNDKGETVLHLAVTIPNYYGVKSLIELGADVNATNNSLETPLHKLMERLYSFGGLIESLQHLLKAGADVFAKTKADNTPLDYAEMYGLDKCVDIIKEHRSRQYFMCLLMGHLQSDCKLSRIPKEILIRIAKFSV